MSDQDEDIRDAYAAGRIEERHEQEEKNHRDQEIRLFQTLARLESKVDSIDERTRDTKDYVRDVSERVRSLEVSRGWFVGAGAGAGALTAWLTGIIS